MSDYMRGPDGRFLTRDERVARFLFQRPAPPAKAEPMRKLSAGQITESQEARRLGKAEAAAKFAEPQSPNPWERQLRQLEKSAATTADFAQLKRFQKQAERWDRDNAERLEMEEAAALRKADPAYRNALEHSEAFLRTVDPDHLAAASNARGYLEASGDFSTYWNKVSEIESAVWAKEDAKTTELAMKANTSMSEFKQQCDKASEAAARLRDAQTLGETETNN